VVEERLRRKLDRDLGVRPVGEGLRRALRPGPDAVTHQRPLRLGGQRRPPDRQVIPHQRIPDRLHLRKGDGRAAGRHAARAGRDAAVNRVVRRQGGDRQLRPDADRQGNRLAGQRIGGADGVPVLDAPPHRPVMHQLQIIGGVRPENVLFHGVICLTTVAR